ncbi:hypothetical protein T7987_04780 [Sulfitobacter faviae]|uniref:Mannitol repressor n=1 Tax=Sulfitobacter faviae TaxID=1775881 RepID=A0ABZ0V103_9RHOB|nr:hypothetical protein [Sulfitobacter faviae]WPZ22565.1 hypothetical protein T7987_04780 [Sulfitobacter faviae]
MKRGQPSNMSFSEMTEADLSTYIDSLYSEKEIFWKSTEQESDRGLALVCLAYLEGKLEDCLFEYMDRSPEARELLKPSGPLGTMFARINMCICLKIIHRNTGRMLRVAAKIRNEFAHTFEATFDDSPVKELSISLLSEFNVENKPSDARTCFSVAMLMLDRHLWPRPMEVAIYRDKLPDGIPTYISSPDDA